MSADDGLLHVWECAHVLNLPGGNPEYRRCGYIQNSPGTCPYDHGREVQLTPITAVGLAAQLVQDTSSTGETGT